ncbi:MAG: hypothetical protein H6772_04140 [Pseudomonadales bacterium]|nr:hypothetical protein [Pseudomonadales bacterium]
MNDNPNYNDQNQQVSDSYVDNYTPPRTMSVSDPHDPAENPQPVASNDQKVSEALGDQNIFSMLGVDDGNEELRENFLNELQTVIWDDFLENDVNLLLTSQEKDKFDDLMAKREEVINDSKSDEIEDELIEYLETLIPDLEEIMLEKALDLKADLFVERLNGMRDFNANNSQNLIIIDNVEKLMTEEKWHSAAELLNSINS